MTSITQSDRAERNEIPTRLQNTSHDQSSAGTGPAWKKQAKLKLQQALGKIKPTKEAHETSSVSNSGNFLDVDPSILKTSTKQNLQETEQNAPSNMKSFQEAADRDIKNKTRGFGYIEPEKSTRSIQNKYKDQYTGETGSYLEKEYLQDRPYQNWIHSQGEPTERSVLSYQALMSPYVENKGRENESHRFITNSHMLREYDSKFKSSKYSYREPSEYTTMEKNALYLDEPTDRFSIREKSKYSEHPVYSFGQDADLRKLLSVEKQYDANKENLSHNFGSYSVSQHSLDYKRSKVGDILSEMKASQDKLKKSYYSYKIERFQYYLNKVFMKVELQYKKASFQALLQKYYEQDVVLSKFFERQEKKLRARCFYGWHKVVKDEEQFLLNEKLFEKKADVFYERSLLKKYFDKGFKNFLLKAKEEQEYKQTRQMVQEMVQDRVLDEKPKTNQQHATSKLSIDDLAIKRNEDKEIPIERELSFNSQEDEKHWEEDYNNDNSDLGASHGKANNALDYRYDVDEDKGFSPPKLKNLNDYIPEGWGYGEQSLSTERMERNIPMPEKLEREEQMSFSDDERYRDWSMEEEQREDKIRNKKIDRKQMITPNKKEKGEHDEEEHSSSKQNKHKPTVQELEERARQRREKVLEIRRKHHEMKMQKEREKEEEEERQREEIRQKQLEEKKKIEQRKREEREKQKKKELEEKRMSFMFEEAEKFHRKALMKYFGMNTLKQLLRESLHKQEEADAFYNFNLKKKTVSNWKEGVRLIEEERNAEIQHSLLIAKEYYDRKKKKLAFKALKLCLNEAQEAHSNYRGHIERLIQGQYIKRWNQVLDELRKEKFEVENANDQIVNTFRFRVLGRKVLDTWKVYVKEEKRDQFKKMQKDYLWGKVNNWLSDYNKKKKNTEEISDEKPYD